jgi:hypothetical protein
VPAITALDRDMRYDDRVHGLSSEQALKDIVGSD